MFYDNKNEVQNQEAEREEVKRGEGATAAIFQVDSPHNAVAAVESACVKLGLALGILECCFKVNLKLFPGSENTFEFMGVYHIVWLGNLDPG